MSGGIEHRAAPPPGQRLVGGDLARAGVDDRLVVHDDLVALGRTDEGLLELGPFAQPRSQLGVEHLRHTRPGGATAQGRHRVPHEVGRGTAGHGDGCAQRRSDRRGGADAGPQPHAEVLHPAGQRAGQVVLVEPADHGEDGGREPPERVGAGDRRSEGRGDAAGQAVGAVDAGDGEVLLVPGQAAQHQRGASTSGVGELRGDPVEDQDPVRQPRDVVVGRAERHVGDECRPVGGRGHDLQQGADERPGAPREAVRAGRRDRQLPATHDHGRAGRVRLRAGKHLDVDLELLGPRQGGLRLPPDELGVGVGDRELAELGDDGLAGGEMVAFPRARPYPRHAEHEEHRRAGHDLQGDESLEHLAGPGRDRAGRDEDRAAHRDQHQRPGRPVRPDHQDRGHPEHGRRVDQPGLRQRAVGRPVTLVQGVPDDEVGTEQQDRPHGEHAGGDEHGDPDRESGEQPRDDHRRQDRVDAEQRRPHVDGQRVQPGRRPQQHDRTTHQDEGLAGRETPEPQALGLRAVPRPHPEVEGAHEHRDAHQDAADPDERRDQHHANLTASCPAGRTPRRLGVRRPHPPVASQRRRPRRVAPLPGHDRADGGRTG